MRGCSFAHGGEAFARFWRRVFSTFSLFPHFLLSRDFRGKEKTEGDSRTLDAAFLGVFKVFGT
jgi:hypothetical protein